jgi:hypothetical protein
MNDLDERQLHQWRREVQRKRGFSVVRSCPPLIRGFILIGVRGRIQYLACAAGRWAALDEQVWVAWGTHLSRVLRMFMWLGWEKGAGVDDAGDE